MIGFDFRSSSWVRLSPIAHQHLSIWHRHSYLGHHGLMGPHQTKIISQLAHCLYDGGGGGEGGGGAGLNDFPGDTRGEMAPTCHTSPRGYNEGSCFGTCTRPPASSAYNHALHAANNHAFREPAGPSHATCCHPRHKLFHHDNDDDYNDDDDDCC
jgi:hypothetical protein